MAGKPCSRTPVFSDAIRYLEFNLCWNVPAGLAAKQELPRLQSNPRAVAAAGLAAVRGEGVYDVSQVDWAQVTPSRFPFQLRRKPGANNALGRMKLMFPNAHDATAVALFRSHPPGHPRKSAFALSYGISRFDAPH